MAVDAALLEQLQQVIEQQQQQLTRQSEQLDAQTETTEALRDRVDQLEKRSAETQTIATEAQSTAEEAIDTAQRSSVGDLPETFAANADLVTVNSYDEGLRRVADGALDAYFADRSILLGLAVMSKDPGAFVVGERTYTHEPYGLALSKGDEDFRLLVDRSLSRVYWTLEITPIFTRYFGRPARRVVSAYLMTALPE